MPEPTNETWEERFDKQFSNLYLINEEREEYDELINTAVKKFISEERKRAYEQGVKEGIIDRGTLETKAQIPCSMFEAIKREGQEEILTELDSILQNAYEKENPVSYVYGEVDKYAQSLGLTIKE